MIPYCVTIQMKAIEYLFHVPLLIMLDKEVPSFNNSLNKTLVCDHSNESDWAIASCGTTNFGSQ